VFRLVLSAGALSLMFSRSEPEADHASLSGVEVKNTQSIDSVPLVHNAMIL
jgi:hypothetical protein